MACSYKTACDVARANSRNLDDTWYVFRADFGSLFDALPKEEFPYSPAIVLAAYKKGRKVQTPLTPKQ